MVRSFSGNWTLPRKLSFRDEAGDIHRFPNLSCLLSRAGLAPCVRASGYRVRLRSLAKQGSMGTSHGLPISGPQFFAPSLAICAAPLGARCLPISFLPRPSFRQPLSMLVRGCSAQTWPLPYLSPAGGLDCQVQRA